MEKLKIGITIGLKDPKESIWTNGMKINILALAKLLMKSEKNYDVYEEKIAKYYNSKNYKNVKNLEDYIYSFYIQSHIAIIFINNLDNILLVFYENDPTVNKNKEHNTTLFFIDAKINSATNATTKV